MKRIYYRTTPVRKRCTTKCIRTSFYVGSKSCRDYCSNFNEYGNDLQGNKFVFCKDKELIHTYKKIDNIYTSIFSFKEERGEG